MSVGVVGVNHLCPISIREKVSFTHTKKIEALHAIKKKGIQEVIILSTCNRSEIYIWDEKIEDKIEYVRDFYAGFLSEQEVGKYLIYKTGKKAIKHLYYVAAGLDSLIIGEDQILGQVREAWEVAAKEETSGKMLNKIFREAISTSKTIKNTLKISENPLSVSYIAVKFLKEKMQSLYQKRILVIGIGKMSQLVIKYLQDEQLETIYVSNRSHTRAKEVSTIYDNVIPVAYKDRYNLLSQVDAVVCATASPHVILQKQDMPELTRKLYMIDIALPRDIDPEISDMQQAELYDIDDLKTICKKNNQKRKELAKSAKEIIKDKMSDISEWIELASIDNTLELLNEKKNEIQKYTLEYIYRKTDLSVKDKKVIDKMVGAALKNLVSTPTANLKKIKDKDQREHYIKVIEELFEL
ncbi:glutamyl-tRNA reductase [Cellulosilyticum sp. I15G10I2]|uniref:glutamyl-tRNA reductase n=1 Tax=Cellulosilyticum sp. I15G10I2 TaxID=1892843 RepID=UPI00085BE2A1|nr:glutamyl-tRNA reductase [Cellulosilyticum sp. I15G10I2]